MINGHWARLLRALQPVFLLIALGFMAYLLYSQWPELRAYPWRLNLTWFTIASGLLLITWTLEVVIWRDLLHGLGGRLKVGETLRIWFISAAVRYIPGNVWQPLTITLLCQRRGIRPEATLASVVLFQIITLLATIPFAAAYLFWQPDLLVGATFGAAGVSAPWMASLAWWLPGALILVPLIMFLVNPVWLMHVLNWMLRKIRRSPIPPLSHRALLTLLAIAVIDWVFWGATFAALTFALGEYTRQEIVELSVYLVAIYPIAYAVGFISFITPSGFGVREGALIVLLAPYLPLAVITVIALALRLFTMAGELILAAISALIERGSAPLCLPWHVGHSTVDQTGDAPQPDQTLALAPAAAPGDRASLLPSSEEMSSPESGLRHKTP